MTNPEQVTRWGALNGAASSTERARLANADSGHAYYVEEEIGMLIPRYRIIRIAKTAVRS